METSEKIDYSPTNGYARIIYPIVCICEIKGIDAIYKLLPPATFADVRSQLDYLASRNVSMQRRNAEL